MNKLIKRSFIFYPNPSDGNVNIVLAKEIELITVYNSIGQKLKEITKLNKGENVVDLSGLESGFYYLQIYDGTISYTQKILIRN